MKLVCLLSPFLFLLCLQACEKKEKRLFWITSNEDSNNDFLFMAESTNIGIIGRDSLLKYLTPSEFVAAERFIYKDFGVIFENDTFKIHVLLIEGSNRTGRDYHFHFRSYSKEFKFIDTYEFATWDDEANQYCTGSIDEKLIIKKQCEAHQGNDVMQFRSDGIIIASSFQGRD